MQGSQLRFNSYISTLSMWLWFVILIKIWILWTVLWVYSSNRSSEQSLTASSVSGIFQILRFKSYLVLNDKLITIAAKISSFDTVWFVYVIDIKSVDHVSSKIDDCGQNVPKSHPYLLWSYLEQLNDNEKMCCISKKEKTKKVLCIHLLS